MTRLDSNANSIQTQPPQLLPPPPPPVPVPVPKSKVKGSHKAGTASHVANYHNIAMGPRGGLYSLTPDGSKKRISARDFFGVYAKTKSKSKTKTKSTSKKQKK